MLRNELMGRYYCLQLVDSAEDRMQHQPYLLHIPRSQHFLKRSMQLKIMTYFSQFVTE